ncbi:unnamed protein product [Didymodactylos carnosus]|uniref:Uncharacterized protein n=1 Tax=Didymodactylos carnosus TaxID=1234261 RepID=A0A816GHY7_9BILA|nr:unnamed protein product [Didymodactylos carnosus]CAF4661680.1 unnamed protein product [Didymodactylos carnosus]
MGSAVTQVLADVYMMEWESDILAIQLDEKEVYVRSQDDIRDGVVGSWLSHVSIDASITAVISRSDVDVDWLF